MEIYTNKKGQQFIIQRITDKCWKLNSKHVNMTFSSHDEALKYYYKLKKENQ